MAAQARVLLVEDSDADSEATVRALARCSSSPVVHRCVDGDEAMVYLQRIAYDEDPERSLLPAVILLDLNLPGTDGRDVLEQIKSDDVLRQIPVVILTTSSATTDMTFCYRHGASGYILKPVDLDKFTAALQQFVSYWFEAVTLPPGA